jgi:hypothetical protein
VKKALYVLLFSVLGTLLGALVSFATELSYFALIEMMQGGDVVFLHDTGPYNLFVILVGVLSCIGFVMGYIQGRRAWDYVYGDCVGSRRKGRLAFIIALSILVVSVAILGFRQNVFGLTATVMEHANQVPSQADSDTRIATIRPRSGIRGVVMIGPVCQQNALKKTISSTTPAETCGDQPYETELAVYRDDVVIKTFTSAGNGNFELSITPGSYAIGKLPGSSSLPRLSKIPVLVVEGDILDIPVRLESGL